MTARGLLLAAALVAILTGGTVAVLGAALPEGRPEGSVLLIGGIVTAAVGLHALFAWVAIPAGNGQHPAERWLREAEYHLARGDWEYARTYSEEAVRWGADPDEVGLRLAIVEARARRS